MRRARQVDGEALVPVLSAFTGAALAGAALSLFVEDALSEPDEPFAFDVDSPDGDAEPFLSSVFDVSEGFALDPFL